jgi:hypothetical protein
MFVQEKAKPIMERESVRSVKIWESAKLEFAELRISAKSIAGDRERVFWEMIRVRMEMRLKKG